MQEHLYVPADMPHLLGLQHNGTSCVCHGPHTQQSKHQAEKRLISGLHCSRDLHAQQVLHVERIPWYV